MSEITKVQYDALKDEIYNTLMAMPDMGMGEMGEATDEANRIVTEWCEEQGIAMNF